MPIFDYKCPSCHIKIEDKFVRNRKEVVVCKQCHAQMQRLFPNRVNAYVFPQEGIHLEHVSAKGKTFHSTQEMRDYAKKNDLELGALL
jgi:putative FmdB family regulatory protein